MSDWVCEVRRPSSSDLIIQLIGASTMKDIRRRSFYRVWDRAFWSREERLRQQFYLEQNQWQVCRDLIADIAEKDRVADMGMMPGYPIWFRRGTIVGVTRSQETHIHGGGGEAVFTSKPKFTEVGLL